MRRDALITVEGGVVTVTAKCILSGQPYTASYPLAGWNRWRAGEHIQTAMPTVSADDREFLISGCSPAAFDDAFKEEDDV